MIDYIQTFNASLERVTAHERRTRFFDRFYERFITTDEEVAARFVQTDLTQQKQMLRESLTEMRNFFVTPQSNPYILTLSRIHGVRGRDIPVSMFDLWLDSLIETVKEIDPSCNDSVVLAWRIVMAPGIEFMKFYRDR